MFLSCVFVSLLLALVPQAHSHMVMEEPPSRNGMWRLGFNVPPHPQDDYLVCTHTRKAPCPPCGDKPDTPRPRPHELGGTWGTGTIVRTYTLGQRIQVRVNVTNSHGGKLRFNLCPHVEPNTPVEQSCFDKHALKIVGQRSKAVQLTAPNGSSEIKSVELRLPYDVTCNHCVLQMTNIAQEFKPSTVMFRNCADIAIQGTAKTSLAGGPPLEHLPSALDLHTRSGFGSGYEEQKQYRFYN
ncbi:hypothetical protein O3P69_002488 [Scylla paramamosain]|uniref:Chitin-binding type-4 domain-containing protein n=1 Tax=Scylla paramamosain TaxID=85552 RepID=A0AAW0UNA1_SCYPA